MLILCGFHETDGRCGGLLNAAPAEPIHEGRHTRKAGAFARPHRMPHSTTAGTPDVSRILRRG